MEYNTDTYWNIYKLIVEYFAEYNRLLNAQDEACDSSLDSDELKKSQEKFEKLSERFSLKCFGKYVTYPVVESTGKSYLSRRKVETGKYEAISDYITGVRSVVDAMLRVNKEFRENGYEVEDEDLCMQDYEYELALKHRDILMQKIKDLQAELKYLNDGIQDYLLVMRNKK